MLIIGLPVISFLIKVKPEDMGLTPYGTEYNVYQESDNTFDAKEVKATSSKSIKSTHFILLLVGAM